MKNAFYVLTEIEFFVYLNERKKYSLGQSETFSSFL